jgi:flagellar basal body-associated protein FliL
MKKKIIVVAIIVLLVVASMAVYSFFNIRKEVEYLPEEETLKSYITIYFLSSRVRIPISSVTNLTKNG